MSEQPMRRRRALFGGLASVALVTGGAAVVMRSGGPSSADDTEDDAGAEPSAATAEVTKRDLEESEDLSGTLGYGDQTDLTLQANGTITALPTLGTVIGRGDAVVEVNGQPVTLWYGNRPLWRELSASSDDGADIEEVEANLKALGYTDDELTVDQEWTALTTQAVKDWQEAMGYEETGTIGPGDVVLNFGAVRMAAYPTAVGGAAAGPVATVTSADRQITIDLEATKQSMVAEGMGVGVELPDGTVLEATVTSVGTVATSSGTDEVTGEATDPTIAVVITLADPSKAGTLDETPVSVQVVTSAAEGVLAVPVDALLALAEGGYAVERVGTGAQGANELVTVDTGAFAAGWVEITGDIAEGDEVVVPG